ncbi:MAG: cysteine desulfurase family protein [Methylococcales bacterium]|nr:cysteine desulfurase family protein [Methylococcales bacterium]
MIYFDNNATTPIDERILEAMLPFMKNMYGNPSSVHRLGRIAKSAVEVAREQVAALVDALPSQVIFTSGGTEANNLAVNSAFGRVAQSAIEHPSVSEPAKRFIPEIITVNRDGLIEPKTISELIEKRPDFVSIMLANNETGVIQPIADIATQLTERGIIIHTDAVQAVGKIPVSFKQLGVQMLSLSGHKIYAPKGSGALIVDKTVLLSPLFLGGGQEQNYRSGTENVAAIVGFGKAAELAKAELDARQTRMLSLRTMLENKLAQFSKVTIFAQTAPRLPNTVLFGIDGVDGELVLLKLDQKGVCVSSGSACASGETEPSHVLLAMGISTQQAQTAIRVSLSHQNTPAEVLEFIELITPFGD